MIKNRLVNCAIGIPAFNEEKSIAAIITRLKKKYQTIIVCNDGSSDLTGEIAEKLGAIVIRHTKNLGYGGAIDFSSLNAGIPIAQFTNLFFIIVY